MHFMMCILAAGYTVLSSPQLSEEQAAEGACSSADTDTGEQSLL